MDSPNQAQLIDDAVRFLTTVFEPDDLILFRPIEAWSEGSRKHTRIDYKHQRYLKANQECLRAAIPWLLQESTDEKTNEFFGICPRFGGKEEFDLACQIRTVRVLWADIDNVSVEEALARVEKGGLPKPSIIVRSGNGVHLYWILDEPYLIDDAGEPTPVIKEWEKGSKRPTKYTVIDDEKVLFDKRKHAFLSPKALHMQDVIAGIAQLIGGDHTQDLARLLRIPGTMNRKDERNGKVPVPCTLMHCDPALRYSLAELERFQTPSVDTQRQQKIQAMPLPQPRKKPTPRMADRLAELAAASEIAQPGRRSQADFALCCYAIENGIDKELVWAQVQDKGKFKDRGRDYFETTWSNAELQCRVQRLETLQPEPVDFGNADDEYDGPVISIDPATTSVAETLSQITDTLISATHCFMRCDQLVIVRDETIDPVLSTPDLQGLLNELVEFRYHEKGGLKYKPLTTEYAGTWLHKDAERKRVPAIKLFTRNPVFTEDWRLTIPGFDAASGIYYAGPTVTAASGTLYLDTLLQDFCFKAPADRANYLGMLLTGMLVPQFIGAKPAALFNGNQPGLGKSILAQIISIVRDGRPTATVSYNPNDEEFEKRLGAIVRHGATTIIIDNAKGTGRRPRIESASLERSITDPVLSYRLLGTSQEIRAENSHIFCITANAPDISPDLVSRSNVINLEYEGDPRRRTFRLPDPEGYALQHRAELLGELIGMVQRWIAAGKPLADVATRFNKRGWGNIVGGILEASGEPDFQANAEDAAVQLDDTRREFSELVGVLAASPQGIWTSSEIVELCLQKRLLCDLIGDGSAQSQSTRFGKLAMRFIAERFELEDGTFATFQRDEGRKGKLYRVGID